MKTLRHITSLILVSTLLIGCGGTASIINTPIQNIDATPIKVSSLTDVEKKHWGHLDLVNDTIPGMSVEKAYTEIIKNKKGATVIVGVIDSGIDIDHEDLDDVIWVNKDEIPNNGKDDDNNGYVDDVHGWNFLGDAYNEQLEFVRILASGDTNNTDYERAQATYDTSYEKYTGYKAQYEQIYQQVTNTHETLVAFFDKNEYSSSDVNAIKTEDPEVKKAQEMAQYLFSNGTGSMTDILKEIDDSLEQINDQLNYNLNKTFRGRLTGDNPDDLTTTIYGNNHVKPVKKSESHGTHVAGIIGAERNNGLGANGVANHVEIMSIRTVPNGDEYDKDVALAIRYAVDNGASIINGSFGKSFSPHSDWVREAIAYAAKEDVVFVHAAGNDSKDVDVEPNFPDDQKNNKEISDSYIRVGALSPKYGANLVAGFSNYGKQNVDVFAPGAKVYSTTPENGYDTKGGTSMAAPAVAGVAALIRSYYPSLKAAQVKQIILDSGLAINRKVVVGGDTQDVRPFADLCKSSKIVNAYNALILASQIAKK